MKKHIKNIHSTLFNFLCIFFITAFAWNIRISAENTETVIVLHDFKLPEYKKNGQLEFILYGKEAVKSGIYVNLKDVLLDVIKEDVQNVSDIKDVRKLPLYKIDASKKVIKKFWDTDTHSKALIASSSAQFDTAVKILRGREKVILRSPSLDIDGIGFDVDYKRQKIHVRSHVKVVLRTWIEEHKTSKKSK